MNKSLNVNYKCIYNPLNKNEILKKSTEKIKLKFGLSNIFDIHYRTFASGISSQGRSFQAGLKVKF